MTVEAALIRHYSKVRRRCYGEPEPQPPPVRPRAVWRIVFTPPTDRRLTWRGIAREVCRKHKVEFAELIGPVRQKRLNDARQEAWWRIRQEIMVAGQPMSYLEIGRRFGGRDHSTIVYGVQQYEVARRR